jgi:N12 class adenine-specific DNA methylase
MRKTSANNNLQLSLFEQSNDNNHANHLQNNHRNGGPDLPDENGRINGNESYAVVESQDALEHAGGSAGRTFSGDGNGENIGAVFRESLRTVSPEHEGTSVERPPRNGSQRDRVATAGGESGAVNYHNTEAPAIANSFNKRQHYRDNIAALQTIILLEKESRVATPDEQTNLAKYVGFGGLKEILLNPANEAEWKTQSDKDLQPFVADVYKCFQQLDPDGSLGLLQAAKRSILNAHYTSYPIINAMYNAVEKAGFKGGTILEPSAGIGNFLAAMPLAMANNSEVTAIEMDIATGKILQCLFPTANTYITGYEKLHLPENSFDLIVSNIPFGDITIYDTQLVKHKNNHFKTAANNIHNYFFAKSILLAKPGGMIAFIASRYTLDSQQNSDVRKLMQDNCIFLGAIRLPDSAFKINAGTEVVSDIIFLKKFDIGETIQQQHAFLETKTIPFTDANNQTGLLTYNEYFHNNPSHLLGTKAFGGLYRKEEFNLKGNREINLQDAITGITDRIFEKPVLKNNLVKDVRQVTDNYFQLGQFDNIGNIVTLENGSIGIITAENHINESKEAVARSIGISPNNIRNKSISWEEEKKLEAKGLTVADFNYKVVEPCRASKTDAPKLALIENLRRLTKEIVYKEVNGFNDVALSPIRKKLHRAYNDFTFRHGNLLDKNNDKVLSLDTDGYVIQALEKQDKLTGKITPADILFKRTINPVREVTQTDNIPDAITLSLQRYGKINTNYVCELMDTPYSELMATQHGDQTFIFVDTAGKHLTRDEYLSGNVVQKLSEAKQKASTDPLWINHVEQLAKVQPRPITATDIYSPLHARWIPKASIDGFLENLLHSNNFNLGYSKSADQYSLYLKDNTAQSNAFACKRRSAAWIIGHALNGIEPIVKYTEEADGREVTLLDGPDTHFAKELYRKVKAEWDDWKFKDIHRRESLAALYNTTFNNTLLRSYNGSHLTLPGLTGFVPRPHQQDAIFRNVQQLGGLNDHIVGAGKTLIQISTAMELRRLAIASKPLIIGLKSQIPQLYESFKKAYPLSKVLFPTEKDFSKVNRQRLLNNIATNDWDCIILSHDQFNAIRQPVAIQEAIIKELTAEIESEIYSTNDKQDKKRLESRLYKYEQKLTALQDIKKDIQVLDFSQLGIYFLMIDESQEYKNLEFTSMKRNVRGLGNPSGSKKAFNLLIACRYLQNVHGGDKGILFSSGTPISNTMAELYLLLKYLRPNKMQELGLTSFDRWAANFANDFSELEYYMGKFKEVHRFREFANLPELITLYKEIADVRNNSNLVLDKPKAEHTLIKIQPSETQLENIEMLQEFINTRGISYAEILGLTAGYDASRKLNPSFAILAINFAKKLSLDPRLINPAFAPGTKLEAAANNIHSIYENTKAFKGTQLVFCDLGTPKSNNAIDNLYSFLENADTPQSDIQEIFGEHYYDTLRKPDIAAVKLQAATVLNLSGTETDTMILEANAAENFSVYAEVKKLLVQKGIPVQQVVFIHDYNTRKQKELLFEQVNNGGIRIVLGSTKRLGTGVNVQQLCVALHHLDISWKPSDIEQRNGRGERQGNEAARRDCNNTVQCFYYATERTLDASMYNIVGQKAKFIAQIKTTSNPEIRIAKDIEEEVDMGSMAAELSGDPVFKEKATLSKRINELIQLEKSFLQKRFNTEDNLRHSKILLTHYEEKIVGLKKTIPLVDNIPRDEQGNIIFSGKINNKIFDKVSEIGMAMITEAEHAKKYKPVGYQFNMGTVWQFQIIAEVKNNFYEKEIVRKIISPDGTEIGPEKAMPAGEIAAALQIKQTILDMPSELSRLEDKLITTQRNITDYTQQLMADFPYKQELTNKKQRLNEVNMIIVNKTKQEENAKAMQKESKVNVVKI